jgi:tRNA(Ile)-lysidine synthase
VLARLAPKLGFSLVAHGVDHGLRREAAEELDLAERHAASLGVPFGRTVVAVAPGGNLQARARTARYAALEAAQRESRADLLATAHHADDRAETVLLRLLRGSGPRGLAVLPPRAGERIRPFLRARKSDILAHLARHGVPFAEDPSNRDRRHQRVRVREELMPLLAELSPGIVEHLNALSDALGEGHAAWDAPALDVGSVPLGRAQRRLLARAVSLRLLEARIPLPGGRVLGLDGVTLKPRLLAHERRGRTERRQKP